MQIRTSRGTWCKQHSNLAYNYLCLERDRIDCAWIEYQAINQLGNPT